MKNWFLVLLLLLLYGCSTEKVDLDIKVDLNKEHIKTVCIDGVTYILFKQYVTGKGYGFMTVKFNPDSTVETCDN